MKKLTQVLKISLILFVCLIQPGCLGKEYPNGELKIFCWGEYLSDGTANSLNVIEAFEKETGVKVSVVSTFDSNEQMYAKLKYGSVEYDLIFPSEYMISRLIDENMIQKINIKSLKNYSGVMQSCKGSVLGYDPTDEYSVPYTWGTVGLVYNVPLIEELTGQKASEVVKGWSALWDTRLEKEIFMFINSRDSFAIAEKLLNFSLNTTNLDEISQAAALLKSQKPLVQAYIMDQIFDKMANNEGAITPAYAGDILTMMKENENLAYCFPEEGSNMFVDGMCIPKNAQNVENAHKFIDFLCREDIATENANFISYSTAISGAWENLCEEIKYSEIAYPPENIKQKCEIHKYLPKRINTHIEELWTQIKN